MIKWLICILALGAVIQGNVIRGGSGQQMKPKLNCTEVGNGNFVYGCSKVFWMCSNGILYSQHCHSELFFDPVSNACERQENIELCTNPNATNLHGPSKAIEAFNCKGKIDSAYELSPCLHRFAHCKSGHVFYEGCPTGTVYDDLKKHCDWPANVVGCQDKERISSRSPLDGAKAAAPPGYGPQDVPPPSIIHQQSAYNRQFKLAPPLVINPQQNDTLEYSFPQITPIDQQLPAGPPRTETKQPLPPQQPSQQQSHPQQQQPPQQQNHHQQQQTPPQQSHPQHQQPPQQQPQQQQQLPAQSSLRLEFDCTGKKDGPYPTPLNACPTFFYRCSRNETYKYNCPHGMYFSAQKVHCDFPLKVPECNGHALPYPNGPLKENNHNYTNLNVQPSPSQNPAQQQQPGKVTVQPSLKIDFNCVDKVDGFYNIGKCRNDYVRCVHKTAYLQECPENFVFDSDICEYIDECLKTVQLPVNGQQQVQTQVLQTQPAVVAPASSAQTYTLKQAQQRAISQTQQTYNSPSQTSNSKQTSQQYMPSEPSFLYNQQKSISSQQPQSQGENERFTVIKPQSAYGQSNDHSEAAQPQQSPPAPPVPKDTYCQEKGLVHGYHSPGCSNYYFACFPIETIRVQCPANLFYDAETGQCDYKTNVPACGGIRPTPSTAQQQPQSYQTYTQHNVPAQQPPAVEQQRLQTYGQGQVQQHLSVQQNQYVQQSSQVAAPVPQQELVFHQPQQDVVEKSASLHSFNSGAYQLQTQIQQPIVQQQQPANTASSWVSYSGQQQQQQVQQSPPAATQSQAQYQPQQQHEIASQPAHHVQQQVLPQVQPTNSKTSYSQQSVQQSPPKIIETFCRDNNLHDGFNGAGCAPYFFVCALGVTTRLHCPTGLYYDQEIHECGLKTTITACGGHKPAPPSVASQQQPTSQGSYGTSSSLPVQQQQPAAVPEFDCQQKQDGIYAIGCSSKYFICNQQKSKTLYCPPGTYYSASTELCDYKAHVIECGGKTPTNSPVSQHPVLIPQKPYPQQPLHQFHEQPQQQPATSNYAYQFNSKSSQTQQAQKRPLGINYPPLQRQNTPVTTTSAEIPTLVEDDKCLNLSNGIYGKKCTKFFFICVEKKSFDFICPKDQAFNLLTVKCAPKTEIQACPDYEIASQQPPVTVSQSYNQPQLPQPMPQQTYNPQPAQSIQQQPEVAATPAPAWVPYSGQQRIHRIETESQPQHQHPANPAPAWVPYSSSQQQNHAAQQPAANPPLSSQQTVSQQPQVHPQPQQSYQSSIQQTAQQPLAPVSQTQSRSQQSYNAQQPAIPQLNAPQQTQQSYQPLPAQHNNAPATQQSY